MKNKTSFLVGNGVNRAIQGNGISWGDLMNRLQGSFNAGHIDLENPVKPFPLSFEEILFGAMGSFEENLRLIKGHISQAFLPAQPNSLHQRLVNSEVTDILTVNYDYCFERVISQHFMGSGQSSFRTLESKNSIRRKNVLQKTSGEEISIWHLHGEVNHQRNFRKGHYNSESILIGYDHYVESLAVIQDYLRGSKFKEQLSMVQKLQLGEPGTSWIDKFYTDRLVMIGIDMEFAEIDLWWLLNHRLKLFCQHPNLERNELVYYQPNIALNADLNDDADVRFKRELNMQKARAKKDVLTSLGVKFEDVLAGSYLEFYETVFKREGL